MHSPNYEPCKKEYGLNNPCNNPVYQPCPHKPTCHQPCQSTHKYAWNFCILLTLVISIVGLVFASSVVGLGSYISRMDSHTLLFKAKLATSDATYVIIDDRIYDNTTESAVDTEMALQTIIDTPVNRFQYNEDWLYVSGIKNTTVQTLGLEQLNMTDPNPIWELGQFPKTRKGLNYNFDELDSVSTYHLITTMWAAIQ